MTQRPSLARHPDFLKLWSAETISQLGTQVSLLAIPLVAINIIKAAVFEVALLSTIEFLPFILFTLPAGVWVDRLRRRPILIIGDLGRAISLASIPIAYELGGLSMLQLYIVGFINGTLTVFFDVAYQSYLPALVDRDQLVEGNSKLEISRSGAQLAGPATAGVLIGLITAPLAIVADSLSYVGSALFVFLIRRHEPDPERHKDDTGWPRGNMRKEVVEGLRYVLGNRLLRSIAGCTGTANLFNNIAFNILVFYLVREIGLTAEVIGVTFSLGSVGFLVAALTANRIAERFGVGPTIVISAALSGPALLLVALAPREIAVPYVVAAMLLSSFATVVYNITQVSLRQAITPERMQGRMNATMRFIVWGTIPVGSILGGVLATAIGLRETIWIGAIGSFLPFLFVLFSPVRSLQRIPEAEPEPGAATATATATATERGSGGATLVGEALDEMAAPGGSAPLARTDEQARADDSG